MILFELIHRRIRAAAAPSTIAGIPHAGKLGSAHGDASVSFVALDSVTAWPTRRLRWALGSPTSPAPQGLRAAVGATGAFRSH